MQRCYKGMSMQIYQQIFSSTAKAQVNREKTSLKFLQDREAQQAIRLEADGAIYSFFAVKIEM